MLKLNDIDIFSIQMTTDTEKTLKKTKANLAGHLLAKTSKTTVFLLLTVLCFASCTDTEEPGDAISGRWQPIYTTELIMDRDYNVIYSNLKALPKTPYPHANTLTVFDNGKITRHGHTSRYILENDSSLVYINEEGERVGGYFDTYYSVDGNMLELYIMFFTDFTRHEGIVYREVFYRHSTFYRRSQ